jgi:hypothetical protein
MRRKGLHTYPPAGATDPWAAPMVRSFEAETALCNTWDVTPTPNVTAACLPATGTMVFTAPLGLVAPAVVGMNSSWT